MVSTGSASPWGPTLVAGLEQRTDEWLAFRRTGPRGNPFGAAVGASVAHAFLLAPPLQRLLLIRGRADPPTERMLEGTRMEPVLRAEYEEMTGQCGAPAVCYAEAAPWVVASLDWLADDGATLAEFKYMGAARFTRMISGEITPAIYTQVQLQLATSGAEVGHLYVALRESDERHIEIIERDLVYQEMVFASVARALRAALDHPSVEQVEQWIEALAIRRRSVVQGGGR